MQKLADTPQEIYADYRNYFHNGVAANSSPCGFYEWLTGGIDNNYTTEQTRFITNTLWSK